MGCTTNDVDSVIVKEEVFKVPAELTNLNRPAAPVFELDTATEQDDPLTVSLITIKQMQTYIRKLNQHIDVYEKNLKNNLPSNKSK